MQEKVSIMAERRAKLLPESHMKLCEPQKRFSVRTLHIS